ncbi:MAG: phospholipase [Saprospiraceae bacterium]|nr:phospholipase [Saprospiraceae bacterium]
MATVKDEKYIVNGTNQAALFTLKTYRGEGMTLLAMDWKQGQPPVDFVGFAIEYKEPGGNKFYVLGNRLSFPTPNGNVNPNQLSSRLSPIQKFRWIHFPKNAHLPGNFTYRVLPVFMNEQEELSYGEAQEVLISLQHETIAGKINVSFTRGFVSSQAFVDNYMEPHFGIPNLLPGEAKEGLEFVPNHPKAGEALPWMGFEATKMILDTLQKAIDDPAAQVRVIAYDLNLAALVESLEKLGNRLKIIIDDDGPHKENKLPSDVSAENKAEARLKISAGAANVKRQHLGKLQHNKTIVVTSPTMNVAICGSTNFSWRGFYVQANNAVMLTGATATSIFNAAFDDYWRSDSASDFEATPSSQWQDLGIQGVKAKVAFSPHNEQGAILPEIALDIATKTKSSLFYSLAFLYMTEGVIKEAITSVTDRPDIFVYGISDRKVGGLDLQKPSGNLATVFPAELSGNLPEPFKSEPIGGGGNRMHHKFVVIDFDKPTARVYFGSYNFSVAADEKNGENLLLVQNKRVAVAYMIEALRIFDHYHFRVSQKEAKQKKEKLYLKKRPMQAGEKPWWGEYYTDAIKIRDRELFG